jgi:hypothetical protein
MHIGLHVKYQLFSSEVNETLLFSTEYRKKVQISNFMKNPSSGRLVVPCGQTDMTKLIVAFRNLANSPNNLPQNKKNNFKTAGVVL